MSVKVVVVQVLHHQKSPSIVLVGWHHDLVVHQEGRGGVTKGVRQQVGPEVGSQVVVHLRAVCLDAGAMVY